MSDPEIIALREVIAKRVRSDDIAQRRRDIDARGAGIQAARRRHRGAGHREWREVGMDVDAGRRSRQGGAVPARRRLRHRFARQPSASRRRGRVAPRGRARWPSTIGLRRNIPFPAAVDDSLAAYRFLLANGVQPGGIAIAGDSAGGGLVVAAMLAIRDAGLPQPACGWAISPWVDMEAIGESMVSRAAADPTVQKAGILDMAKHYLNGADPRSPLAAPIYADLRGLAPLLIQVGAAETLLDDAIRLAQVAGAADVAVDLADLARDDPRLAHLSSRACGRTTRHCRGRRIRTRDDIAWLAQRLLIGPLFSVLRRFSRTVHEYAVRGVLSRL